MWRELCCCRSSRRISDSYFLLEMLGSAAPQTIRVKQSRFFPLPARFGCRGGLVFTLSLPAFSGWRLYVGKVHQCCSRIVLAMLSRYWAEDDRLCHTPTLPTQKCILAVSLIKTHIKYATQQGLEVFGHQAAFHWGTGVSLVWYELLACHLAGRAAKESILVLQSFWTD